MESMHEVLTRAEEMIGLSEERIIRIQLEKYSELMNEIKELSSKMDQFMINRFKYSQ